MNALSFDLKRMIANPETIHARDISLKLDKMPDLSKLVCYRHHAVLEPSANIDEHVQNVFGIEELINDTNHGYYSFRTIDESEFERRRKDPKSYGHPVGALNPTETEVRLTFAHPQTAMDLLEDRANAGHAQASRQVNARLIYRVSLAIKPSRSQRDLFVPAAKRGEVGSVTILEFETTSPTEISKQMFDFVEFPDGAVKEYFRKVNNFGQKVFYDMKKSGLREDAYFAESLHIKTQGKNVPMIMGTIPNPHYDTDLVWYRAKTRDQVFNL